MQPPFQPERINGPPVVLAVPALPLPTPPERTTRITVDLAALVHNLGLIRQRAAPAGVCAVVKGDAYGHGMLPVAQALAAAAVDWLAVVWLEDGLALRRAGIRCPILVMAGELHVPAAAAALVAHALTPVISTTAELDLLAAAAPASGLEVHLEVDTGMSRLGVPLAQLAATCQALAARPQLRLTGLMSHFATADRPGQPENERQLHRWRQAQAIVAAAGLRPRWQHVAHSAATLTLPECHEQLVRCGLLLYGLDPMQPPLAAGLAPILSWQTEIVALRQLPAGTPVSYHGRWRATRPSQIATLPVGYADGYRRGMTGRAQVLIQGQRCPVIGTICMDFCMVDVTQLTTVALGEPVILLGRQGTEQIDAHEMAAWADTIAYEITCGISPRLPRRYLCQEA